MDPGRKAEVDKRFAELKQQLRERFGLQGAAADAAVAEPTEDRSCGSPERPPREASPQSSSSSREYRPPPPISAASGSSAGGRREEAQLRRAHLTPKAKWGPRAQTPTKQQDQPAVTGAATETAVAGVAGEPGAARGSSGSSAPSAVLLAAESKRGAQPEDEAASQEKAAETTASADSRPRKRPPPTEDSPLSEPQSRGRAGPPSEPQLREDAGAPRKKQRTRSPPGINYFGERPKWNEGFLRTADGNRVPSTIALVFNVVVITKVATKEDVFRCILHQTAAVVFVVWDPELFRTGNVEGACSYDVPVGLRTAVEDAVTLKNNTAEPYWTTVGLFRDTGVVLVRPHIIAETAVAGHVVGATHAVTILRFRLKGSDMNPAAVIRFAVVSRHAVTERLQQKITQSEQTAWHPSFFKDAVASIHKNDVRFLCGLFDIPPEQLAALGRSCGASCTCPVGVVFRAGPALFGGIVEGTRVMHPNYVLPIGPCDVRIADYNTDSAGRPSKNDPQWLPDWMHRTSDSIISRRWVPAKYMPKWEDDPDRSSGVRRKLGLAALPPIGKVIQKELNEKTFSTHWCEGIHQNVVFVGHGRQSRASKRKHEEARSAAVADER